MTLPFLWLLIIFALLIFISKTLRVRKRSSSSRKQLLNLPPGPRKLPLIGNLHNLAGSSLPHRRLAELARSYGPIMHLQLGELPSIVVSSPETAKEVLKTHDIAFAQRPFLLAARVIFYNYSDIASSGYGDYWRQMRKICLLEVLSVKRVQSFRWIREEETSNLIRSISSSAGLFPVNLSKMVFSLTNTISARSLFGKKCENPEAIVPAIQDVLKLLEGFNVAELFPSIKVLYVLSGMKSKIERTFKKTDMMLQNIISEHRASKTPAAAAADVDEDGEALDLVEVLLNIQDHGELEFPLTDDNIKAVIMDMFVAGTETSATTIEWAMTELLKNPRAMEKAQIEVRQVFGGKRDASTEAGLDSLDYLKLVIKETMRLHPPAPLLVPRECREQRKIYGYDIPIQTKVIVNAWAIGRDPNYWVEPEKFDPERFADGLIDYKGTNFEYLPFGAGRRMCPGISYGIAAVEHILAQLLYHFDWKLPNGMKEEECDMAEDFGLVCRRKKNLQIVAIPYK